MDWIDHAIRRLPKRLAVTSVVVTHDMQTTLHTADRIAYLHDEGRIYFYGLPDDLRASRDLAIVNFIDGHSSEAD